MKSALSLLFAALCCAHSGLASAASPAIPAPQLDLPQTQLKLGRKVATVQVARSEEERALGLMGRSQLGADEGMLFIFPQAHIQCFWMRNTLLPLSAAFITEAGRIVQISDMRPLSDEPHCSPQPVRYVLEMPQGWFEQGGIKLNAKVKLPD